MANEQKTGGQIYGIQAIIILIFTSLLCFIPILFIGLLKIIPNLRWQCLCTQWVDNIVAGWTSFNNSYIARTQKLCWEVTGLDNLNRKDWYLIVANHQSWLDIIVLHKVFNRKIPTLKFFIKNQLKWVPLLGFAWWAMGCPFMKRYSKEYLAKKPQKKGKDLEATKKAIKLFQQAPSSIMNFVEGTRYSKNKSQQQQSPYQHLLKPKAGGISFVISAMGKQINSLLDVTIIYPEKQHSLWDFLCKRVTTIKVQIRQLPIPRQFINDSFIHDEQSQMEFKNWLNNYWLEKDNLISTSLV